MKIDILTLFPDMFKGFKSESIIKRAIETKKVKIKTHNFRDFATNKHKKVDDTPYGGGAGMVLMCDPIFRCIDDINKDKDAYIILMTPDGVKYNEKIACKLRDKKHIIIICGHYEGFDERIRSLCDAEISMGDFVLTGGEIPASAIVDSVVRLIPGVIDEESLVSESFTDNRLDYPNYTKPRVYRGMEVPEVLVSGNHEEIDKYREKLREERTKKRRPDLLGDD